MIQRPFWLGRLEEAWKEAPTVWLSGVSYYPRGANYLGTPQIEPPYLRRFGKLEVTVCAPEGIVGRSR